MKLFFLAALWAASVCGTALKAQTVNDENEGTRFELDSTNSIWRFKWWGHAGRTYFLQHSDDLNGAWNWLPVVEPGANGILEYGLTTNSDIFFMRLRYTDDPTSDPSGGDFDLDGVSNLAEVQQGTDPFRNVDSDGDGIPDDWEVAHGLNPGSAADVALNADGDPLSNLQEYQQGSDPNDYYSQGATTVVSRVFVYSGGGATVEAGQYSTNPVIFKVVNAITNAPLVNAPVTVEISAGNGRLALTSGESPQQSLVIRSDSEGLVKPYFKAP